LLGWAIVIFALLATLRVAVFTVAQIPRATTSVPWLDQWLMVDELARHERGQALLPILWSPYWGHRPVISRLLFFADARWGSLGSLTWLTMAIQFAHMALLIALAWLLLGRRSLPTFVLAGTVIVNLMLSPFQMENFVWSIQTMVPLVFAAATASFVCLALSTRHAAFLVFSMVAAMVGSYTMPNGLLVWPVLVIQAVSVRLNRRTVAALAIAGAAVIATYLWHYDATPAMGMGVSGMLRHPLSAVMLVGLLLAGPFDFISPHLGVAAGLAALIATACIVVRAWRIRVTEPRWVSVLLAVLLFLFLTAVSLVAGRLDPRWLGGELILPDRYFTFIGIFWAAVAILVLYTCWQEARRPLWLAFYSLLFFVLMFTMVSRKLVAAEDWADVFRGTEAVGSAFLLDVSDEQLLPLLWPSKAQRDEWVAFLRRRRLAMFAEPRAAWPAKRVSELFTTAAAGRCIGAIERTKGLDASWRVEGWAWDTQLGRSPDDIVLADTTGRIAGLARGGFRHGYFPGLLMEPEPVPASHANRRHSEWLGYARGDPPWTIYGVISGEGKVCLISP
jgi:hypothetical protein